MTRINTRNIDHNRPRVEEPKTGGITPKKIFKTAEKTLSNTNKCLKAFKNCVSCINDSLLLTQLGKLPSQVTNLSKSISLFGALLLPFDVAKFGAKVQKALDSETFSSFARAALEAVSEVQSILNKVISPLKTLHSLKIIPAAPFIPFLNLLSLPSSIIKNGLAIYDLVGSIRRFAVLKSHSKDFEDAEEAITALNALKDKDIKQIHKDLELGKDVDLAARVNALQERLVNDDEAAVGEATEFYKKMKERASLTLGLRCATTALNITSLALDIFSLIPTPVNPLVAAIANSAIGIASFGIWAGKECFLPKDIAAPARA